MSEDMNHPLEGSLKAYARTRRDQFGPAGELPGYTRKTLQEEIGRVYGQVQAADRASFWEKFLPKLGFAAAGFAVLIVTLTVLDMRNPFTAETSAIKDEQESLHFARSDYLAPFSPLGEAESAPALRLQDRLEASAGPAEPDGAPQLAEQEPAPTLAMNSRKSSDLSRFNEKQTSEDSFYRVESLEKELRDSPPADLAAGRSVEPAGRMRAESLAAIAPARPSEPEMADGSSALHSIAAAPLATTEVDSITGEFRSDVRALGEPGDVVANGVMPPPAAPAPVPPPALTAEGVAEPAPFDSPERVLNFVQVDTRARYRQNLQSPPTPSVLGEFRLEMAGEKIRVVDADGSIYEGALMVRILERAEALDSDNANEPLARGSVPSAPGAPAASAGFQFQVTGVNRSLNQPVTIQGTFSPASLPGQARSAPGERTNEEAITRGIAVPSGQGSESRVQARVNVGGTTQFNIEAVTRSRP
jgi:hypothetical protein